MGKFYASHGDTISILHKGREYEFLVQQHGLTVDGEQHFTFNPLEKCKGCGSNLDPFIHDPSDNTNTKLCCACWTRAATHGLILEALDRLAHADDELHASLEEMDRGDTAQRQAENYGVIIDNSTAARDWLYSLSDDQISDLTKEWGRSIFNVLQMRAL